MRANSIDYFVDVCGDKDSCVRTSLGLRREHDRTTYYLYVEQQIRSDVRCTGLPAQKLF